MSEFPGFAPLKTREQDAPPTIGFAAPVSQQQQQQPPLQQQPLQQQQQQQQPEAPSIQPLTANSTVVHVGSAGRPKQPTPPAPVAVVAAEGRRNKVPLEKGFSQVAWLKLSRSGADLTGGAGRRRDVTLAEVARHNTEEDAWMVLQGKVYAISPYLRYHPGGADILAKAAGTDGTRLFNKYHPWVNAHALLERCLIGLLHTSSGDEEGS